MDYTQGIALAGIIMAGASAITAITKTPRPGSVRAKIYKFIEILALVVGRVKETGEKK